MATIFDKISWMILCGDKRYRRQRWTINRECLWTHVCLPDLCLWALSWRPQSCCSTLWALRKIWQRRYWSRRERCRRCCRRNSSLSRTCQCVLWICPRSWRRTRLVVAVWKDPRTSAESESCTYSCDINPTRNPFSFPLSLSWWRTEKLKGFSPIR